MKARSGFALVELLVAIGVFLAVMSIGVGGFARALRTIRQNAGFVSASGNVSLVLEQMAREMRTGYDFCVNGENCSLPDEIAFKNAYADSVTYRRSPTGIIERTCTGGCNGESGTQLLTPANVLIEHLDFVVFGNAAGDTYQPRVTISVGISTKDVGTSDTVITLQTTISSRFPLDT